MSRWFMLQCEAKRHIGAVLAEGGNIEQPNQNGQTPLMLAISQRFKEMTHLLLEHGADMNAQAKNGVTALMEAADLKRDAYFVRLLLEQGADPHIVTKQGSNAFKIAADAGNLPAVKALWPYESDIDAQDNQGWPALMHAVWADHAPTLRFLLKNGADIHIVDKTGRTPLLLAAWGGKPSAVSILLEYSANVHDRDIEQSTPLMLGTGFTGDPAITSELLRYGAEIEARNTKGETALLLAARNDNKKAVTLLLEHGADVNVTDNEGGTPLSWAKVLSGVPSSSYAEIARRLLAAGAEERGFGSDAGRRRHLPEDSI